MTDNPDRYNHGDVECIDAIKAALTPEEYKGFCKGNIMKYLWRESFKGKINDVRKARYYIVQLGCVMEEMERKKEH